MAEDGAPTHKIDYVVKFKEILNLKGNQNGTTGSRITAIFLKRGILPIGGGTKHCIPNALCMHDIYIQCFSHHIPSTMGGITTLFNQIIPLKIQKYLLADCTLHLTKQNILQIYKSLCHIFE